MAQRAKPRITDGCGTWILIISSLPLVIQRDRYIEILIHMHVAFVLAGFGLPSGPPIEIFLAGEREAVREVPEI
jgi:hypothetical protein